MLSNAPRGSGPRLGHRWLIAVGATLAALLWLAFGPWVGVRLGDAEGGGQPPTAVASGDPAAGAGFRSAAVRARAQTDAAAADPAPAGSRFALAPEPARLPVHREFADPPRAGLMFDVGSGEILWERHPGRELPIASLTKMMTAHLIVARHGPDERVLISKKATKIGGSMVGVLPRGKKVPLGTLLKGLLLVSGNDAATALAEHDSGTVKRFVSRMNAEARRLGLDCTHFSSPHGLVDENNYSCPRDLATLARVDLSSRRIAAIARSDRIRLPFPINGGFLDLYNNNPFIRAGDRTITGLKTGYTDAAGRCYVTTALRDGRQIGVVLLDSPDPLRQVPKLLELGAKA